MLVIWSCIRIKGEVLNEIINLFKPNPLPPPPPPAPAPPATSGLYCCPFHGGYSDADHLYCNSSIVANRCTTAHFLFCGLVLRQASWLSSLMDVHFAFCFRSVVIVVLLEAASRGNGEVSRE